MAPDLSPSRADGVFSTVSGGILVSLSVTPKARASIIDGIVDAPDGPALRVRITESPEKGKANAAVIKLLSREWKIPRKNIRWPVEPKAAANRYWSKESHRRC